MPVGKPPTTTARSPRARKTAAPLAAPPQLEEEDGRDPDEMVTKHVRYRRGTYATAEARARAEGRDYIDVLRAFTAKYADGTIPSP